MGEMRAAHAQHQKRRQGEKPKTHDAQGKNAFHQAEPAAPFPAEFEAKQLHYSSLPPTIVTRDLS
jgi:hypothetical protein